MQGLAYAFTWGNKDYRGVKTTVKRADAETLAGLIENDYTFSIVAERTQFDTLPRPRIDKVAVDGSLYRVLATTEDSIGATVRIDLGGIDS